MTDIYLNWGQDFVIGADGDLLTCNGFDEITQNLTRQILTNPEQLTQNNVYIPADYYAEPQFGQGMRALIGRLAVNNSNQTLLSTFAINQIITKALQACANIPEIAKSPAPTAVVTNPAPFQYNLVITVTPISPNATPASVTIPIIG